MKHTRQANKFLNYIARNYDRLKAKMASFCHDKKYEFDEDVFADTYMKVYERILRDGIKDHTDAGFENYFFISFKTNLLRSSQYAEVSKRDWNITDDDLYDLYDDWYNDENDSSKKKLISDLYKDFSVLYIMKLVETTFDTEHFNLFKLKTLGNLTYKELSEKTKIKGARTKVLEVKRWLMNNENLKDDIRQAFYENYAELIEY